MNNEVMQRLADIARQKAELSEEEDKIRQEVLAEVRETVRRFNFTEAELLGGDSKKRIKGEAAFKSPYDEQTWTGRGRKPDWYKKALDEGKSKKEAREISQTKGRK